MGTSLTGLTPATTYDALIKVGDNGPLSATAKYLSDGLGNDSPISMSTTLVGIGTNSPDARLTTLVGDNAFGAKFKATNGVFRILPFETGLGVKVSATNGNESSFASLVSQGSDHQFVVGVSEAMRITSAGNVGIGTTTPSVRLTVKGDAAVTQTIGGITVEQCAFFLRSNEASTLRVAFDASANAYLYSSESGGILSFGTRTAPNNNIIASITANGLTFNGDTAAANALDDYEEGTFTPAITFGGGSTGITYANQTGSYTKIGNQVTVNLYIELTNKGSATGSALITGLPFTIGAGATRYGAVSLWINNLSFANQIFCRHVINSTTLFLTETTEAGVTTAIDNTNFANATEVMITATYFV